jgi:Kdo2-lipid IVA lauroyltransferase/acyltransferase
MDTLSYFLLRFMIFLVRITPFRVMYFFSDLLSPILYRGIRYRRKVVHENLSTCFPEKTPEEILTLEKQFYHHLCDISLESMKGFSMSPSDLIQRHHFNNPELATRFLQTGRSVLCVPSHLNNWEWGALSPGVQIDFPLVGLYKPLSNKKVDAYARKHRAGFHMELASIHETSHAFEERINRPYAYVMAADQSPSNLKECLWVPFFGIETAWLHGPEKYARKYNLPVLYAAVRKLRRGFYEIDFELITDDPGSLPPGEITRRYAELLEISIRQEPAHWLWSHRRWKHRKADE